MTQVQRVLSISPTRTAATKSQEEPATPEQTFRALLRTLGLLKRVMEPYFARFGISGSQWAVLRTLLRAEAEGRKQLRLTDLGSRLLIRPPSVTGVVDRLQRMGFVARVASATDQRAKYVTLTPAGRKLLRRVLQNHPAQVRSVLSGLKEDQRDQLHGLLEQLGAHLETLAQAHDLGMAD